MHRQAYRLQAHGNAARLPYHCFKPCRPACKVEGQTKEQPKEEGQTTEQAKEVEGSHSWTCDGMCGVGLPSGHEGGEER